MKKSVSKTVVSMAVTMMLTSHFLCAPVKAENQPPQRDMVEVGKQQFATKGQIAQVQAVLVHFNQSTLTVDNAKAIHRALRDSGLRGGPLLDDAIRAAGWDPEQLRSLDPPPGRSQAGLKLRENRSKPTGAQRNYSVEQAISDRAQLHTIAFNGLAFFTGNLCSDTFIPPGKVSDFFGFQYMRDIDGGEFGHNTSFLPAIANNMLAVLDGKQKDRLILLAHEQVQQIRDLALQRFPLIKAYRRLLENDIPTGSTGLNKSSIMRYTAEMFELDGLLAYRRAEVLGSILRSLNGQQKADLQKLTFGNSATWPKKKDQVDKRSMSHATHVAVMTYASEMFSWYKGSNEADTYFCPERHGTYFGGFYMKDKPAMGNPGYSISTSLTGNSGEKMLMILDNPQRQQIVALIDLQRNALQQIVETRRAISVQLRHFMTTSSVDKNTVLTLARRYGELDGELAYLYATSFAKVFKTLSGSQKEKLMKLRNLEKFTCRGAYLYSDPIDMPTIPNTDFLFRLAN